ncbi:hypothetical protein PAPHI01_0070 [Pancytospora philotis]|nr:hypothetical protein PAPHI01_0070 [Pancytospora philotis]
MVLASSEHDGCETSDGVRPAGTDTQSSTAPAELEHCAPKRCLEEVSLEAGDGDLAPADDEISTKRFKSADQAEEAQQASAETKSAGESDSGGTSLSAEEDSEKRICADSQQAGPESTHTDESSSDAAPANTTIEKREESGAAEAHVEDFLSSKDLLTADKISDLASKNIFTQPGAERVRKASGFLQTQFVEAPAQPAKKSAPEFDFSRGASLFYWETDEWIPVGEGEAKIYKERFVFIRSSFALVVVNCPYKTTKFEESEDALLFEAPGRKTTSTGVEIVKRKYRLKFNRAEAAGEFLEFVRGQ